jgi:succinoglycan biosynthesis transport protein ExoP
MSRIVQSSVFNLDAAAAKMPEVDLGSTDAGSSTFEEAPRPVRILPIMDPIRDSKDSAPVREPENASGTSSTPKITALPSKGPPSPFLQEATKLVYKLFSAAGDPALSSVLFCGIDQAHNSSAICVRTGEILAAQMQKSVCVVDANLRSPSIHNYFGLKNQHGFSDAILQQGPLRGFAQQLPSGNLWVMTAGAVQPQGLVFSSGEQLRSRMLELRSLFDYVLIDAAPAGLFLDAIILGQLVDGAILVIEPNSTKRETAFQAKGALEAAKVRILGAVLNSGKPT